MKAAAHYYVDYLLFWEVDLGQVDSVGNAMPCIRPDFSLTEHRRKDSM